MACGTTGTCGSGCYKDSNDGIEDSTITITTTNTMSTPSSTTLLSQHMKLCYKCKEEEVINSTGGLCGICFRNSLFAKFKQSITTHDLISPTDNVLIAFSGGPSSRVVLEFVHEIQQKAQKNSDASRDKLYPVFGVGVAFIDESVVTSIASHDLDNAIQDLRLIVSSLAPPTKELHIVPIQSIFSTDLKDGRNKLNELLDTVSDATGKEDLLCHLRMQCLQKIAFENKYNKLVLGSCTSRIACHVLSAAVKGQGYSLPADIQYIDARWETPVVLPLRDCLAQELNMLCRLNCLKTLDVLDAPRSGINDLVSKFLTTLQEENPARERTIVRTAEKLIPFHFNRLKEMKDPDETLPRRHRRKANLQPYESVPSEFLCSICCSPVKKLDVECLSNKLEGCETNFTIFGASCCPSCQFQILPKDLSSREQFYSLLPRPMTTRASDFISGDQTWLREQIKDCLLSDSEDGI
ncbi:Cytoplasmic trna 2-thiolation protein [Thalictrum thalictroides]|uniref:Cytoplasmic tRNA 2-thiolation protein 2 n=1 Tax=Thalictrum thalictroides TaxID=46969 RepID=A0A7J6WNG9_THATH|nr:Cytoplasmic trna 2-thiolation protein [Thalictrum thalictroides]